MTIESDEIRRKYEEVLKELSNPELISDWERMEGLTKQKGRYEKIIEKQDELSDLKKRIDENWAILAAKEDEELAALAEAELKTLKEQQVSLQKEIEDLMRGNHESVSDIKSVMTEIRAGVGGEEAALFAADLFRMYSRYAQKRGWRHKILHSSPTELGGYKEIVFELSGGGVHEIMQNEGGVHRVQRIPSTEKSGRVHTSTCSVAILPKPKKGRIEISPKDLKVDTYKSSGPGGQYVNKRMTAARITHLPTGLVVTSQTERSLLQNKENAMTILEAKLLERAEEEKEMKIGGVRREQIKQAKRAEKIRTYNFPQDRITDHRIKKSWHNIQDILGGNLDAVIKALQEVNYN